MNKWEFLAYLASAFTGFLVAGVGIDLFIKTEYSIGYIGAAIIGAYVLVVNFYMMWLLLKGR